ncbi:hypothetical protein Dsin_018927 [Dipteronia sinensis]|uniref:Uncharacterized protein n=1 Tax=Dipteronia sinensis TaxID=43782 RepID=A0AAE0E2I6_9ROSI|nr:hypothetical protein Dsin_018927 [Dipteronia sinensis]
MKARPESKVRGVSDDADLSRFQEGSHPVTAGSSMMEADDDGFSDDGGLWIASQHVSKKKSYQLIKALRSF